MKYGPSSSANTEDAVKAVCLLSQGYLKYKGPLLMKLLKIL